MRQLDRFHYVYPGLLPPQAVDKTSVSVPGQLMRLDFRQLDCSLVGYSGALLGYLFLWLLTEKSDEPY